MQSVPECAIMKPSSDSTHRANARKRGVIMDFNKIKEMGLEYAEKGRNAAMDLAERGRTQAKIVSEQTKLARAQRQLGALVYSLAKGNEENQPLVDKYIEMISSIEANLRSSPTIWTRSPPRTAASPLSRPWKRTKSLTRTKRPAPSAARRSLRMRCSATSAAHSCNAKALKGRCPRRGMPPFLHRNRAKCENSGNN